MKSFAMDKQSGKPGLASTLLQYRIGPLPVPVFLVLAAITVLAALNRKLPNDMIGGFAVLMLLGFLLGEVGARIPLLRHIGGSAILCLFVPSALIGYDLLHADMLKALTTTMKTANLQYFYIACLVAGSILGMNHRVLVQGFMRMFLPLLVGTIAAVVVGMLVGLAFGYSPMHTFFFIIVPIVGGGIGEGILPLSIGYAEILGRSQDGLIAMMVPAALVGNVVAILASGILTWLGERRPGISGNGVLVRSGDDQALLHNEHNEHLDAPLNLSLMGAGLLISCAFFILGSLLSLYTGIPGPILMIVAAALLKVSRVVPPSMELGAYQMYKFVSSNLTFAILVGLGALFVSWKDLAHAFSLAYVAICASAVVALVLSGYLVGKWLNMYPVEAAIVTACHSGLGGTGDVAILSAANRIGLMPFAQISTRIGGALMVVLATLLLKWFH
nr:2-hydroxycarboxylate transporter family protein [Herbaspirillum sp. ASV7]